MLRQFSAGAGSAGVDAAIAAVQDQEVSKGAAKEAISEMAGTHFCILY